MEYAPTTGRKYFHGITVHYKQPRRNTVDAKFGLQKEDLNPYDIDADIELQQELTNPTVHIDQMMGTIEQAISYICKEGSTPIFEYGQRYFDEECMKPIKWLHDDPSTHYKCHHNKRGEKVTDEVVKRIKQGAKLPELLDEYNGVVMNHINQVKQVIQIYSDGARPMPVVFYLWGDTGCGKSASAYQLGMRFPTNTTKLGFDYYKRDQNSFWEQYCGQLVTCFDDIADNYNIRELFNLLDREPYLVNQKGSSQWFTSRIVCITADRPPEEMWNREAEQLKRIKDERWNKILEQFKRRISHTIHFDNFMDGANNWQNRIVDLWNIMDEEEKQRVLFWDKSQEIQLFRCIDRKTGMEIPGTTSAEKNARRESDPTNSQLLEGIPDDNEVISPVRFNPTPALPEDDQIVAEEEDDEDWDSTIIFFFVYNQYLPQQLE